MLVKETELEIKKYEVRLIEIDSILELNKKLDDEQIGILNVEKQTLKKNIDELTKKIKEIQEKNVDIQEKIKLIKEELKNFKQQSFKVVESVFNENIEDMNIYKKEAKEFMDGQDFVNMINNPSLKSLL